MTAALSVLLVEDDQRVSDIIGPVLNEAGFSPLGVVSTANQAEAFLRAKMPDLMLVDLGLPDRDGVELIRNVRSGCFRGPILVLTSSSAAERVLAALEAGADGYLFKEDMIRRLASSLREVANGGVPLSRGAAKVVLERLRSCRTMHNSAPPPLLTSRERDVLTLLSTGAKYAEIAGELGIGVNTVRSHIRSLYDKCGAQKGAEVVNLAWNLGLLRND